MRPIWKVQLSVDVIGLLIFNCLLWRGIKPADDYTCFNGKRNENHQLRTGFFVQQTAVSAVTRVEFISGTISYIVLRDRRYGIIVLNAHAPTESKSDDSGDSLCDEVGAGVR
jgi:hypothetical protein